jgi:RimJ/RimL family protein N-acetyltransferase
MGVPAVVLSVADNQVPLARALARRGVVDDLGPVGDVKVGDLVVATTKLAADARRRTAMTERGMALVDGVGARRVAAHLRGVLLTLRPAGREDCRLLWEWANDPTVREWAFHPEPIPWDVHVAWFAERLSDARSTIYIAAAPDGGEVGQTRFEDRGRAAEVSVSVAESARGRGWGAALVDASVRRYFAESDVDRIVARVLPGNERSAAIFAAADFDFDGERSDGGLSWRQYARVRDER